MPLAIDKTTYDKARHPPKGDRRGFQARVVVPSAILIHATQNKNKGTALANEARYLFEATEVSAHYLIGKAGEVVQFLDPRIWNAWHSGDCAPDRFENRTSIGIELHAHATEAPTAPQLLSLKTLVQHLMWQFSIGQDAIARHGSVAVPPGRKTDPAGWPEAPFARWRATLTPQMTTFTPPVALPNFPQPPVIVPPPDPWIGWGQAFPLPPEQQVWAIPQLWLANAAWMGEARSHEVRLHPLIAYRVFRGGAIRYEELTGMAYLERFVRYLA
jgi:hypothetical protein